MIRRIVSENRRRRQRGGEIVEGATAFLVFFVMVFAIVDFSRMVWSYHQIAYGARVATRYAMVHGSSSGNQVTVSQLQGIVASHVFCLSATNLNTTVTFTPNQGPGSTVKITVAYSFHPISPFLPSGAVPFSSTSQEIIYQ